MKKILIALCTVCALSACTSDQLKSEHQAERQALNTKQQADRQEERAGKALDASTLTTAAATANLAAKTQAQKDATAALQQLICPNPEQ